jgi:hypothetical protein
MSKALCTQAKWLAMAAAAALSFGSRAEASVISFDFTATITSGPLSGQVDKGSFSYDSSSIIPGGVNDAVGLLTALNFTFEGVTYNAHTANTGSLAIDRAVFGSNCVAGRCEASAFTNQWFVEGPLFAYATPTSFVNFGAVTYVPVPVPEPGSLTLLAIALLGLGGAGLLRRGAFARSGAC